MDRRLIRRRAGMRLQHEYMRWRREHGYPLYDVPVHGGREAKAYLAWLRAIDEGRIPVFHDAPDLAQPAREF